MEDEAVRSQPADAGEPGDGAHGTPLRTWRTVEPPGLGCAGEVDPTTHAAWRTALTDLPTTSTDVHLDLSELRFIDTRGTALLVDAIHDLGDRQRFVLHTPPPLLPRILGLMWPHVSTRIEVHAS